ncbi:MAG: type VI secretion system lipoprotein TssJ [Gammaproteobacteria bacterium]|nr:type VI secretion system lipoprotein TssJ [Gammaproteobacteria bacterium]
MNKSSIRILLITIMVAMVTIFSGCSLFKPIPNTFKIAINADAKVNPDKDGRPSPVVLRIYELNSDEAFKKAEFFDIYDNDKEVLDKAFVKKQEMELTPNESRKLDFVLNEKTKFIAFLVAFQDIDSSKWREIVAVEPRKPTGIPVYGLQGLTINLEKNKINIENKD